MIISRTPVRLSFFGGGTDYPEYFLRNRGAVMGTTIDKYIYLTLNAGSPFFDHRIRVSYSQTEAVKQVSEIQHPSVRATLQYLKMEERLDIHSFADLPAKSGLGSSSAFTVGLLHACHAHQGTFVSAERLGSEAIHIERELLKESVGIQDQMHAAHGGLNIIRADSSGINVRPVVLNTDSKWLFQRSLMMFYTSMTRSSQEVSQEQVANTKTRSLDNDLEKILYQVDMAEHIFGTYEGAEMIQRLGSLMAEGWEHKKRLASSVSNSMIDGYYDLARKAGALGGKIAGAGSGGFLLLVVEEKDQPKVRRALSDLLEVSFRFESQGSTIIYTQDPPQYRRGS